MAKTDTEQSPVDSQIIAIVRGSAVYLDWFGMAGNLTGLTHADIIRQALYLWAINRDVPLPPRR